MKCRSALSALVVIASALLIIPPAHATTGTSVTLAPDPGELLTGGTAPPPFTLNDSTFSAHYDGASAFVQVNRTIGAETEYWSFQFAGPATTGLAVGTYTNITRAPFRPFGEAGFDVVHNNTGCNTISGSFTINRFTPGPLSGGYYLLLDFDADFAIECSNGPTLRGHVSYQEPPDTTPPQIDQYDTYTVEADTEAGASSVYYNPPGALDDRDGYVAVTCDFAPGGFLPIGTRTVTCSASDSAGNTAVMQFNIVVVSPFQFGFQLASYATVSRAGAATVSGTVSCNREALVEVSVHVEQLVARRVTLSADGATSIVCTPPSTGWSVTAISSAGAFAPGKADVRASAVSCPYFCHYAETAGLISFRAKG